MISETSRQSYEEIKSRLGERQEEILRALERLQEQGMDATDFELTIYLEQTDPNYVRPRRYELVNKYKLIGFSDKRRCRITGKMALAWKILRTKLSN